MLALADRLQTIVQDQVLRARLGRPAAEYTNDYDWLVVADQIAGLYNNVLASRIA